MGHFGTFTEPYEYEANGFLIDATFNIYLRHQLQWMIGYKIQRYQPNINQAIATIQIPDIGTETLLVDTNEFKASGVITGFLWKF